MAHFSNYYRWMEAAEHAFLKNRDIALREIVDGIEIAWPRVACDCQYLSPLRFGEVIEVSLEIAELKNRAIRYEFQIRATGSSNLVAKGSLTVVCAELKQNSIQAIEIPSDIRKKLEGSR